MHGTMNIKLIPEFTIDLRSTTHARARAPSHARTHACTQAHVVFTAIEVRICASVALCLITDLVCNYTISKKKVDCNSDVTFQKLFSPALA